MHGAKAVARFGAVLLCLALTAGFAPAARAEDELASGRFALVDRGGAVLLRTGVVVSEGDFLLTPGGEVYRVASLHGAQAELEPTALDAVGFRSPLSFLAWPATAVPPVAHALAGTRIAIYSTHGDETLRGAVAVTGKAGADAVPVMSVADSFAAAAVAHGLTVSCDTTSHWPHDGDAYRRSALTVRELLRGRPDLLLDWQTDRPPAAGEAAEEPACLLVVGGSSPRMKLNLSFARALMTRANQLQAGTVKGILVCRGDYAQVYYPAAVVVMAGTAADDATSVSALAVTLAGAIGELHTEAAGARGSVTLYTVALGLAMLFQRVIRRGWRGRWR
ncbi:MAG: stage II sporulation protein P [Chloroflexota bacterium]